MRLIIDGKCISGTKVELFSDGKCIYVGWIHHNTIDLMLDSMTISTLSCKFWTVLNWRDDISKFSDCDMSTIDYSDGINEDLIAPDLQYPYITTIELSSDKDTIKLMPKKIKDFEDMIIFVPDEDVKVTYSRKEEEKEIRKKIRNNTKKNIMFFLCIYPVAIVIALLCIILPNYIDSYSLARLLGPIFFFSILLPPGAIVIFTKDYIRIKKFLLCNPNLT